jgi:hypothetical protein
MLVFSHQWAGAFPFPEQVFLCECELENADWMHFIITHSAMMKGRAT